jgi:hypothetical protein
MQPYPGSNQYQPYPGSDQPPARRTPPPSVTNAVWLMYAGAAVSVIRLILDILTRSQLKADLARHRRTIAGLTPHGLAHAATGLLVIDLVVVVLTIGLWILIAEASRRGQGWARITGTVLFALDTISLAVGSAGLGLRGSQPTLPRIAAGLIWVIGLVVVVLLWQRKSNAFFRGDSAR